MLIERQMREDEASLLHSSGRRRSADQYVDSMKMQLMFGVMVKALQFLKLADTNRIPVERTTLADMLAKWGAFPHADNGKCSGCDAAAAPSSEDPAIMVENVPPPHESKLLKIRNITLDVDLLEVRVNIP